jgi:hypothetical protein
MKGASIETTLELWASPLRDVDTSENRPIWGFLRVWRGFHSGFPVFSH